MALQPMWRVQVSVPLAALVAVRAGILAVDSLAAGGYDSGLFEQAVGIEQFRPLPGSSPALGEVGQCQRVPAVIVQFHLPPDQARLARVTGRIVELPVQDTDEIERQLAALRQAGVRVEDLEIRKADLEDVFITLMSAPRDSQAAALEAAP